MVAPSLSGSSNTSRLILIDTGLEPAVILLALDVGVSLILVAVSSNNSLSLRYLCGRAESADQWPESLSDTVSLSP